MIALPTCILLLRRQCQNSLEHTSIVTIAIIITPPSSSGNWVERVVWGEEVRRPLGRRKDEIG
jgi:hypothetical protein